MSFEDDREVEIDYEDDMFYITGNDGDIRAYRISEEPDLIRDIIEYGSRGDIDVYVLESEENKEDYDGWQEEIREEYKDKYGEDFDNWRW